MRDILIELLIAVGKLLGGLVLVALVFVVGAALLGFSAAIVQCVYQWITR